MIIRHAGRLKTVKNALKVVEYAVVVSCGAVYTLGDFECPYTEKQQYWALLIGSIILILSCIICCRCRICHRSDRRQDEYDDQPRRPQPRVSTVTGHIIRKMVESKESSANRRSMMRQSIMRQSKTRQTYQKPLDTVSDGGIPEDTDIHIQSIPLEHPHFQIPEFNPQGRHSQMYSKRPELEN